MSPLKPTTIWRLFRESERGFGERSWRYSSYIVNGVVQKVFIEEPFIQNSEPDPFNVSDADTMLTYIKETC